MLPKYGSIPQCFFEFSDNLREWNVSFKSKTDNTSHLELPYTENVSLTKGYAKLFFTILTLRCLKSVTTLLSLVNFLLINITGLEYAENSSFNIPIWHNHFISLSINALSSSLTWYGLIKNGDLSVTPISTSIFGHVPISSLKINTFLYLYSMFITPFFSSLVKHELSKFMYFSSISLSVMCIHSSLGSNHDTCLLVISALFLSSMCLQIYWNTHKVFFCFFKLVISTYILL